MGSGKYDRINKNTMWNRVHVSLNVVCARYVSWNEWNVLHIPQPRINAPLVRPQKNGNFLLNFGARCVYEINPCLCLMIKVNLNVKKYIILFKSIKMWILICCEMLTLVSKTKLIFFEVQHFKFCHYHSCVSLSLSSAHPYPQTQAIQDWIAWVYG